jgi:hypothetical protein
MYTQLSGKMPIRAPWMLTARRPPARANGNRTPSGGAAGHAVPGAPVPGAHVPDAVEGYSHQEGAKTPGASPDDEDGLSERPFINGGNMLDDLEGWSENNASASEAVVKAERHTTGLTIEKLQDRTVKHVTDAQHKVTGRTSVLRHDEKLDDQGNPKEPTETTKK